MKARYKTSIKKITSLHDLQSEKARIKAELIRTEEGITANYHQILHAFSLRNIVSTVSNDVVIATNAISKTISVGKSIFGKIKKRKKKKHLDASHETGLAPEAE